MAYLNESIPPLQVFVRAEYLYDLQRGHGELVPGVAFGVASISGRALGFHVLMENGAQIARLPISALVWKPGAPEIPLDHLQVWDCFSYSVSVHAFSWLKGCRVRTWLRDGRVYEGTYLFTVDWAESPSAEAAGDIGHKNAHILRLDAGVFAAQPNNRVLWLDPATVVKPFAPGEKPGYLTNTREWSVEGGSWRTEDSSRMFYEVVAGPDGTDGHG
jgi:hypothetical protein